MRARVGLVRSLLVPHFTYCDAVFFDGLRSSDKKSLERAFNACVRFAFGLRKRESVRGHVDDILGCGLMRYLEYHTLTFLHNLILRKAPAYLHSELRMCGSARTFAVNVPRTSTRLHDSLFVSGVVRYNALPVSARRTGSMDAFKSCCFDHVRRRS